MGMPDLARRWTREEVLALPDDGIRYELLDGRLLVTPSPRPIHQLAVGALYERIQPYLRRHGLGVAFLSPADLDLRSDQSLQPDLFVAVLPPSPGELAWSDVGIPPLVVEVVSPATALNDRNRKRIRYQQSGVAEYWIVDLDARLIERWKPTDHRPEILTGCLEWQPNPTEPPLAFELSDYFREVWRE